MAKDPAFLFYPSVFLTGTMFMTNEQVGKYIRLLCAQHQHGHLTAQQMQSLCGGIADAELLSKFQIDSDGNYFNERLELEIIKRKEHSLKQKENANKRWQCRGNAVAMPLKNTNTNKDTTTVKDEDKGGMGEKKQKFDFKASLIGIGVSESTANDWIAVRQKKRAANTETAFKVIASEIEKTGLTAEQCVKEAVAGSWQGLKAEWIMNIKQNSGQNPLNKKFDSNAYKRGN